MEDWRKFNEYDIICCKDEESFITNLARNCIDIIRTELALKGYSLIILGGGSTPKKINQKIVEIAPGYDICWDKVEIFLSDERCVSHHSQYSNYKMLNETLIKPLEINSKKLHQVNYFEDPAKAAKEYGERIGNIFSEYKTNYFDLALLGVGEDGHTASLFPRSQSLNLTNRYVAQGGKGPEGLERITLTPKLLNKSKNILFVVNGSKKGMALRDALKGDFNPLLKPIQLINSLNQKYILNMESYAEFNKGGMKMHFFKDYIKEVDESLMAMITTAKNDIVDNEKGMESWVDATRELFNKGNTMFFIGNGASAMMAGHMSADANKNGKLKSMAFNETAIMTAVSNDISYEEVFSFQVEKFGNKEDILITISSSGNSPNIIKAIESARNLGMKVITLSGMKEDNKSRQLGDLNFYIPAKTYGIVEVAHQALLHCWLDKYLDKYEGGRI